MKKVGNTYYCHYAVSAMGLQNSTIGVATSQSLEPGTWQDHGSIGLPLSTKYNLIDPFVFQEDPDGPAYFTFGSYWHGIQQIEMSNHTQLMGWTGTEDQIRNIIRNTTVDFPVVEGAIMHKHEEFFYLFYSVGWCCRFDVSGTKPIGDVYHVVVCRSECVTGPFFDAEGKDCLTESGGTTILASHGDIYAPGGQDVMVHPENGRAVMAYHYSKCSGRSGRKIMLTILVRPSHSYKDTEKFFGFNYLDWVDGWPVVVHA